MSPHACNFYNFPSASIFRMNNIPPYWFNT